MFGTQAREQIKKAMAGVKANVEVDADTKPAVASIEALRTRIATLAGKLASLRLTADDKQAEAAIARLQVRLLALTKRAASISIGTNIDTGKLMAAEAGLLGLEAAAAKLVPAVKAGDVALGAFGRTVTGGGRGWGILLGNIKLFGGVLGRVLPVALASVAVWHVLADAIIELGAVWIPATIAVGAFAAAASDAAVEIRNRMQAAHTVMDATGRSIPGLTSGFEKMHNAVRPQVYQLFGDALTIMNSKGGTFNKIITGTGTVLDQLAARITAAVTTGGGFNSFMGHAVTDVAKLGDSIGNVFGIFGNFFKAIPGFATGLLTIGDDFTKILEKASAAAVPVTKWILLLHGYILYSGLAVTATLAFIGGVANLARQFVTFAAGSVLAGIGALKAFGSALVSIGLGLAAYVESIIVADGASASFAAALAPLAANPMVWVAAVAVALGALVIAIGRSKDAAQSFNDTMQQTIQNASLGNVVTTIQQAQAATSVKLAAANVTLNKAMADQGTHVGRASRSWGLETSAVYNASKSVNELTGGQAQLAQQHQIVTSRVAALSKQYGGNTAALGLLNAAGITTAQITDKNGQAWAQALIQIDATVKAYQAMGTQAGVLGNDLDVLGRTLTDQYKAVQTLNQGWSSFISDVTGTQGAFDTVAQGFSTLATHSGTLRLSLGKLKTAFADSTAGIALQGRVASATAAVASAQNSLNRLQKSGTGTALQLTAAHARLAAAQDRLTVAQQNLGHAYVQGKSSIDALTPAGIALNQAFSDQVVNVDKLFASWRTAGLAGNLFTSGVAAAIAPLEKYAAGSQEATAQLVALAQEAGYQGPVSLSAMNKFLGISNKALSDTAGSTRTLKDITNQATTQEALLTGAMQAQGSFIASKLLGDINSAILAYSGVEAAVKAYGTAVAQSGKDSADAKGKMVTAIAAIVKAEVSMGDNANQMAAIVAKTFGISMPAAMALVKSALGDLAGKAIPGVQRAFITFAEVGLNKTKGQAHDLWNEIVTRLGPKLDALGNLAGTTAKNKFIDWAEHGLGLTKSKATDLWKELVTLQNHVNALHGKNITVTMTGNGYVRITEGKATYDISQGAWNSPHAAGGFISEGTGPTADDVPARLSRGEYVIRASSVARYGQPMMDRINAGAFAAGGPVSGPAPGYAKGGLAGDLASWPGQMYGDFQARAQADMDKAMKTAVAKALAAGVKAALAAGTLGASGAAIVRYAESFLGKIPYRFGGTGLSADDCSGFVQAIYGHYKINAPRTSEAQYGWAKKSGAVPGALAFYVSPAGGPPPGHVAIVADANSVVSQGGPEGVKGPKMESLRFLPLMGTGVPPGGLPASAGGGGNAAIGGGSTPGAMSAGAIAALWTSVGGPAYAAANMARIAYAESGDRPGAVQQGQPPGLTGWGLYQITPTSGIWQNGRFGNLLNAANNSRAALSLFNVSGYAPWASDPVGASLTYQGPHAQGGLISGYAAGGTVAQLRSALAREQAAERAKYFGLAHSFATGPAKYRTATVRGELGTLAKRQAAEQLAYAQLAGTGLTTTRLHHLGATARSEARTAADKGLSKLPGGHPGFAADLRRYLGQISTTSGGSVPAGSTGGGSTGGGGALNLPTGKQLKFWLGAAQYGELLKYRGLEGSFASGPAKYRTKTVVSELGTLAKRQAAEAAAYKAVISGTMTRTELSRLGSASRSEYSTANDQALSKMPGGHPLYAKDLRTYLAQISRLTGTLIPGSGIGAGGGPAGGGAPLPAPPPGPVLPAITHTYGGDIADTIGAFLHSVAAPFARGGMVLPANSFDRGGMLPTGASLAWNGTGRPEPVGAACQQVTVTLEVAPGGNTAFEQLLHGMIRKHVKVRGGGNIQRTYGVPGTVSGSNTWRSG